MTRVAALYDIHGNLPALEAVLAEAAGDADAIVIGGDCAPSAGVRGSSAGTPRGRRPARGPGRWACSAKSA